MPWLNFPGWVANSCSDHLGKFQWLVRGGLPDLALAVRYLATRVTKWKKSCDE